MSLNESSAATQGAPAPYGPPHSLATWLLHTRKLYLDFLRNLGPQIVLASLAWLLALRLDFARPDLSNAVPTLGFFVYLGAFIWSFWANSTLFLEQAFPEFAAWRKSEQGTLSQAGLRGSRFFFAFMARVMKHRPVEGLLSLLMLVLLEFMLAAVLASSIAATINLAQTMR